MSTAWGRDWRKLYVRPSSAFLALPLSVRGLADELLRYVEDDGRLYVGTERPAQTLARVMGAHPRERRWLEASLEALLADGFCAVADGYLVVRNFVTAQKAVGPSAERMRTHREKASGGAGSAAAKASPDAPPTPGEHGTNVSEHAANTGRTSASIETDPSARKDSPEPVTVTGIRLEEKRPEQNREEPPQTPPAAADVEEAGAGVLDAAPVRLGDRERLRDTAPDELLWALAAAGANVETRESEATLREFGRVAREIGLTLDDCRAIGARLKSDPPAWWRGRRITVGLLLGRERDGRGLSSLRAQCTEARAPPEAPRMKHQADLRAAERAWGGIKVGDELEDPLTGGRLVVGGGGTA